MIDPADDCTRPLPQPTRLTFESEARIYVAVLDEDMFGTWSVVRSWGGKGDRFNGGRVTVVASFEEGLAALKRISRAREKQGYARRAACLLPEASPHAELN